jgi:Arc/MetJ family transcription regulator
MRTRLLLSLVVSWISEAATGQEGVPAPQGLVPEQMWFAPTAADWQKPVAIRWQRTWDDAVRLSQQTKRPILVCVNMDGEIASEHYAGVRYRDPELAKLWEPYVCVIASVYRHTPRDHDDEGRRIPCPRLGHVTCGEHMAMEPIVYEKFLDGKRISPRHIMVELDGSEVYDVFYTWDTQSVFDTLRDGIKNRKLQAPPIVKGDRSIREQLQSPDSADREAIESMFRAATPEQRQELMALALAEGERAPIELLRQAAWSLDPELVKQGRAGMLQAADPGTVELIADTLKAPLLAEERQALAQSLRRFAGSSVRAQSLAAAHSGLAGGSSAIDANSWSQVLAGQSYASAAGADPATAATARDEALRDKPMDAAARLDVAESNLLQAFEVTAGAGRGSVRLAARQRELLLADASRHLDAAAAAGAAGWRPLALQALLCCERQQMPKAYELAIQAAPLLPPDAPGRVAMEVLALFAAARQEAIVAAVRNKQDWDPAWMTDIHTTYSLLRQHPLGTDRQVAMHFDFLLFFGAPDLDQLLQSGLERFPASALLHERWRQRLLEQRGPDGLEAAYAERLAATSVAPAEAWFAGYASLCAAEAHRRTSQPDAAAAAYGRGIGHFERYAAASGNGDGAHYVAMAHGGLARLCLQQDDLPGTFAALQRVFAIAPAAAAATDGLGITAMQTAEMLRGKALDRKDEALLLQLQAALQALPPEAFELPEYERASRGQGNGGARRRR